MGDGGIRFVTAPAPNAGTALAGCRHGAVGATFATNPMFVHVVVVMTASALVRLPVMPLPSAAAMNRCPLGSSATRGTPTCWMGLLAPRCSWAPLEPVVVPPTNAFPGAHSRP